MKDFIKKLLREHLVDELSTTNKCVFGSGCYHTVYTSAKNPNRLYKVGLGNVVDEWVRIFNASPNLFPKVYRVFPSKKDPRYFIVEIEKLNTTYAEQDFTTVAEISGNFNRTKDTYNDRIYLSELDEEKVGKLIQFIKDRRYAEQETNELINLVTKWCRYLITITPLIQEHKEYTDFHGGNFGYDNNGNIKAIDV